MKSKLATATFLGLLLAGAPASLGALELRLNAPIAAPGDLVIATSYDIAEPECALIHLHGEPRVEGDRVILEAQFGSFALPVLFICPPLPEGQSVLLPSLPVGDYIVEVVLEGETLATAPLQVRERTELFLWNQQVLVEVTWDDPRAGTGQGRAVPLTDDSGGFWFFEEENLEVTVKVIDGRAVNDHLWVFIASMTDVGFTLKVTRLDDPCFVLSDPPLGPDCATRTYVQPSGMNRNFLDTEAFEVPGGAS